MTSKKNKYKEIETWKVANRLWNDNVQPVKRRENNSDDGPDSEEPLAEAIYQVIVFSQLKTQKP